MARKVDGDKLFIEEMKSRILDPSGKYPHDIVVSDPPAGKCKVINLYVNPQTGKLEVEYDNQAV